MNQKTYKYGKHNCKAYKKPVGKGWEVGFTIAGHQVFVGNFIHAKEATAWWTMMNKEAVKFSKKYKTAPSTPIIWTCKFLSNYMYRAYYSYLDTKFGKYQRDFAHAVRKDERKHMSFKRSAPHGFKPNIMRRSA